MLISISCVVLVMGMVLCLYGIYQNGRGGGEEKNMVQAIVQSPFRVLKVFDSPSYKHVVYIASDKSTTECGTNGQSARCVNDSMCGSDHTAPTCYFFTEPKFLADVGTTTKFIGSLTRAGWLDFESLRMDGDRYLYFSTYESDAGDGPISKYKLDMNTGAFTLLEKEESRGEI